MLLGGSNCKIVLIRKSSLYRLNVFYRRMQSDQSNGFKGKREKPVTTGGCSSTGAGSGVRMLFWSEQEAGTLRISILEAVLKQFYGCRSLLL
uniref:Uncharacterized protein n=1 Tax=Strongyloides stercoralis TaxID=6248 RepID=A0A0K0DSB1_STRER